MSISNIWQLAQAKLASECMREDHNLLLVVGHANLLYSLTASEHEQRQRFEKEFPASNGARSRVWRAQPKQLHKLSEKLCSSLAPLCCTGDVANQGLAKMMVEQNI
jgi:hypothetical protein